MASEPVDKLAAEAEDARLRVAATIDAIQDRLSPRRLMGEAVDRVSDVSRDLVESVGTTARSAMRQHPLAIGAAVAAVGLALLARRSLANARVDLGDDLVDYSDYDDDFGHAFTPGDAAMARAADSKASRAVASERPSAGRTRERLSAGRTREQPSAGRARERLSAGRTRERLSAGRARAHALASRAGDRVEANPLVSIVIGLAAGAALGALFPTTDAERRLLDDSGFKA
jgi:ElaB/YqjD/DUF883 family membrane-anchored ribosome-binding protein